MTRSVTSTNSSYRLSSIDFVRGLVIVIMALDHIRDLLHTTSLSQDPADLNTTTPALFFTRWITHFCAPTFVFLAGTSAYLMSKAQNDPSRTRNFLLSRGLWLILLELTVICFGIFSDIQFRTFLLQVIFAIGSGFVILSCLLRLPGKVIGAIGLFIVLLHDALPNPDLSGHKTAEIIWSLFFKRGFFTFGARGLIIGYPIVPWLGIMLLGFGFGRAFELDAARRKRLLLLSGSIALFLFVLLRFFNGYGDSKPWSPQSTPVFSALSFLNVTKYPPSLLYTCMTLSVMFFILALAEGRDNRVIRFFITYGRVPMFFYLLHWYFVHASMYVMLLLQGVTWQQMPLGMMQFGRPEQGVGLELPYVYLYWAGLIVFMYPLCRWYGRYKAANRHNKWLSYL